MGRVSVSPVRGDGDGHAVSWYFQAFVLWWLSLAVCCASSESQSSSGRNSASVTEWRDCGLFSTDVLATLTLFQLVLLKTLQRPGMCSPQPVCQPSLPGPVSLCPYASNTARCPRFPCVLPSSRAPCFSMVHLCSGVPVFSLVMLALLSSRFHSSSSVQSGAPVFSLDTGVPRLTVSVRCLAGAGLRVQAAPQHKGLLLPGT